MGGLITVYYGYNCNCLNAEYLKDGCSISISSARQFLADEINSNEFRESIAAKSGNRDFDYAAAQTLSKLTDIFGVLPAFLYFKKNSGNAYATPGKFFNGTDGTILFGRDLLFDIFKTGESPEAIFSGICAHEFAHILQFKKGIDINRGNPTVKKSELHADFLAGYFAGYRKLENKNFPAAVIAVAHGKLGDYNYNNPNHHGTPEERSQAIVEGFESSYRRGVKINDAFNEGLEFVSKL